MREDQSQKTENAKTILATFAGIIFVIDMALAGGHIFFKRAISLIFYQSLDGTIWKCQNWVVMDEGQFCHDE